MATDHERRERWLAALNIIESLGPLIVVAGHKDRATRTYIRDFDKAVAESAAPEEVIDKMMQLHGERGNPISVWVAADCVREQLGRASLNV
jgi:hypothetical protein